MLGFEYSSYHQAECVHTFYLHLYKMELVNLETQIKEIKYFGIVLYHFTPKYNWVSLF